jgi:hypothetical protein
VGTGSSGAAFLYQKNTSPGSPANRGGIPRVRLSAQPACFWECRIVARHSAQTAIHRGAGFRSLASRGILEWLRLRPRLLSSRQTSLSCRNSLADNHHPGGTGPPEPRESRLVQAALPSLNLLNTMQLRKLPLGARHWHSACSPSRGPFSRARWRYLGNSSY